MAIRGAQAKIDITKKISEIFPGSFTYEKEIRIPYVEDGVEGQIKLTLTAAKTIVGGGDTVISKETKTIETQLIQTNENTIQEPTVEEKERLTTLLNKLGL